MYQHNYVLYAPPSWVVDPAGSSVEAVNHVHHLESCTHRLVAVVHPADQLLEEVACLVLTEATCLDDAVKQLPTSCILHDYAQVGGREVQLQDNRQAMRQHGLRQRTGATAALLRCHCNSLQDREIHRLGSFSQAAAVLRNFSCGAGQALPWLVPDLFEADYVGIQQHPVVENLSFHILVHLQNPGTGVSYCEGRHVL